MTLLKVRQVALLRRSPANLAPFLKPRLHIPNQIPFRLVAKVQARHTEQAELAWRHLEPLGGLPRRQNPAQVLSRLPSCVNA